MSKFRLIQRMKLRWERFKNSWNNWIPRFGSTSGMLKNKWDERQERRESNKRVKFAQSIIAKEVDRDFYNKVYENALVKARAENAKRIAEIEAKDRVYGTQRRSASATSRKNTTTRRKSYNQRSQEEIDRILRVIYGE